MILDKATILAAASEARSLYSYRIEGFLRFDSAETYDLFISHSFQDKELVIGLVQLFKKAGYKVYVDWIEDRKLDRENVNENTAKLIRERIKRSHGLAYISTSNIVHSKWCPWELGVSDGMHERACILPVMMSEFKGQEYLSLYPYIEYGRRDGYYSNDFVVIDQNDESKYIELRKWLSGNNPYKH